uniref:Malic enzyme n=1 Tax=Schistocephalus solidus TaxID=70667 RepID=A0A0V0J3Q3_SCHSO
MRLALFQGLLRRLYSTEVRAHGIGVLRNPSTNKGTAFPIHERQLLGIHGLLPPVVSDSKLQVKRMMANLRRLEDDLQRYIFLIGMQDRNETLFYKVVTEYTEYCMPLIYTPTVGLACQRYGLVFRRPRGLYITIHDRFNIDDILRNWPEPIVRAIVVTDGERILGLGDLGAYGMGIPVGKLSLYSALAGVNPRQCLPIVLDVGSDNQDLLSDPYYLGVRHNRVRDSRYDELLDNFMRAVVRRYGNNCLIQFEDFGNRNAFRILQKYRDDYCTFNDDIQGTASVTVAGLIAAGRLTGRQLNDDIYLFVGAGEAATGIAHLLKTSMVMHGVNEEDAIKRIYMFDKDGLLVEGRPKGALDDHNKTFARDDIEPMNNLEEIVKKVKPTVLIGASGVGGLFTHRILQQMTKNSDKPIIFALSNPTDKAECTAEMAYKVTQGNCVFASGSPFGDVTINVGGTEKTFRPGQCNNSYIFPGVGLAITACKLRPIAEEAFAVAAECLAEQVKPEDLALGRVFPPLSQIRPVSLAIAVRVAEYAYNANIAHQIPKPENLEAYICGQMYQPEYEAALPECYDWPAEAMQSTNFDLFGK